MLGLTNGKIINSAFSDLKFPQNFPDREDTYWYYDIMFKTNYLRRAPKDFDGKQIFNLMVNKLKKSKCFVNLDHHKLTTRQSNKLENYRDWPEYYPLP